HMEGVRLTRWLLSPIPTFKLWRRMKLWELRSYEQVIKLEQDRLIYRARLQARFGRAWRRKAPVEALMPLRLAKYGVPLTEAAPHGLEAAGLDLSPAMTVERLDVQALAEPMAGEHARAVGGGAMEEAIAHDHSRGPQDVPVSVPTLPQQQAASVVDLAEACRDYIVQHGAFPNAGEFAYFLADAYGVTDEEAGGPVPAIGLEPWLDEFGRELKPITEDRAPQPVMAQGQGSSSAPVNGDPSAGSEPRPFFEPAGPQPSMTHVADAPYAPEPVPAPSASASGDLPTGGEGPQQTALDGPAAPTTAAPVGEPAAWDASVSDTGAATVRLPEQQTDEPELDSVGQQIVTVAGWLAEAEEAGEKLSGAEVARRLQLSPKTGQRRVNAAAEYLKEQRRQQGRTYLRSVSG
ncbi:hypothetical protein ABZ070_36135, partial [Streptomyces sp. NPDC006283]|uniref:hypothetical protein n=1 Tax=Streptomyces sp. NPDC006283 TaxID=3156741 RepID=UPI0033AC3811